MVESRGGRLRLLRSSGSRESTIGRAFYLCEKPRAQKQSREKKKDSEYARERREQMDSADLGRERARPRTILPAGPYLRHEYASRADGGSRQRLPRGNPETCMRAYIRAHAFVFSRVTRRRRRRRRYVPIGDINRRFVEIRSNYGEILSSSRRRASSSRPAKTRRKEKKNENGRRNAAMFLTRGPTRNRFTDSHAYLVLYQVLYHVMECRNTVDRRSEQSGSTFSKGKYLFLPI